MSGDSEEKKHQPTDIKLKRARKEGNIAHSNDVLALSMWPILLWLFFNWSLIEDHFRRLLVLAVATDYNSPTTHILNNLLPEVAQLSLKLLAPIIVVVVIVSLVVAILDNGGFVFSVKPVTPEFNRINPAEGFKRIFSMRTAVESIFNLVKLAIFSAITVLVFALTTNTLQASQACGLPCLPDAFSVTTYPLLAMFLAVFVFSAVIDFLLSRALFKHDMRMSHTELKRENKDTFGNPEHKRYLKDLGQSIATGPKRLGLAGTTFIIAGAEDLVGLRYVETESLAPFVVLKASGDRFRDVLPEAMHRGIPIIHNDGLALTLAQNGFVGNIIPQETFTDVAMEILRQEAE